VVELLPLLVLLLQSLPLPTFINTKLAGWLVGLQESINAGGGCTAGCGSLHASQIGITYDKLPS